MNIYDKRIYVSVIKLTMHMRSRIFLTINYWFLAMFSSVEAEVVGLAVYFFIYVYLLMLTWLPEMVVYMLLGA